MRGTCDPLLSEKSVVLCRILHCKIVYISFTQVEVLKETFSRRCSLLSPARISKVFFLKSGFSKKKLKTSFKKLCFGNEMCSLVQFELCHLE